jgi:choline-sulfatase
MPQAQPNILLIQTDQQKASSLDLHNQQTNCVKTTALRRVANTGVVFDAGYCPYPLCVPSRTAMLTGRYPSHTGYVGNRPFPFGDRFETLFTRAKDNGYHTMLVGKDYAIGMSKEIDERDRDRAEAGLSRNFDRVYNA